SGNGSRIRNVRRIKNICFPIDHGTNANECGIRHFRGFRYKSSSILMVMVPSAINLDHVFRNKNLRWKHGLSLQTGWTTNKHPAWGKSHLMRNVLVYTSLAQLWDIVKHCVGSDRSAENARRASR